MENFDEDFNFEELCYTEDDEDDYSSEESLFHLKEMGSSSSETDASAMLFAKYPFRTAAYQMLDNFTLFSPFTRRKEDMKIKDVVKDNVLQFLPAKSLIRFKSVSTEWNHRIKNPFLAHQQSYTFQDISGFFCQNSDSNPSFVTLNHAAYGVPTPCLRFLPDLVNIRSSCSGLLLCQARIRNNSYYICNPATKAWKELPGPEYYHGPEPAILLAFEPSVLNMEAHYELICAVPLLNQPIVYFELYSSETSSWRLSATVCVELEDSSFTGNGFYMKGMAYWETSRRKVLAFDMKNEIHGIISLPSDSPPGGVLAEIQEELCYISISNYSGNEHSINIYGGADMRLRRRIDIHLKQVQEGIQGYRILPSGRGDAVIILVGSFLYSYSMSDQRIEVISREGCDSLATTRFLAYVNTLVRVA